MFNAAGNPSLLFEHQPVGLAPVGGSRVRRLPLICLRAGWDSSRPPKWHSSSPSLRRFPALNDFPLPPIHR